MRYQCDLGVSTHNKSSSARIHLYDCLMDKYVIKVAEMFQLKIILHHVESTFIIA